MSLGEWEPYSEYRHVLILNRSPDGQALMLSSSDGYCSIVVFDVAELGTVHPTQQHHRQLAAIAQSHSHSHSTPTPYHPPSASSTPVPHSPAISLMRQSPAPARSEREGSTSSSVAPHQSTSIPPLFITTPHPPPPSSTASSVDPVLPTPGDESDKDPAIGVKTIGASGSEVGSMSSVQTGMGSVPHDDPKRMPGGGQRQQSPGEGQGPKKKRRVALTQLEE